MQGNHNQHFAIHAGDRHDENPFVLALLLAVCLGLAILAWFWQ